MARKPGTPLLSSMATAATHGGTPRGASASQIHARAAQAFSAVSALYDSETEPNQVVGLVRAQTIARLTARFGAGDRVLELGCGTGIEAIALARSGIHVVAIDVAPGMLAQTAARVRDANLADRVTLMQCAAADAGRLLDDYPAGSFCGAYSSFGPLNCEPDLGPVAVGLAQLIRPGGRVLISAINRFHPFEFAWYALHGDLSRATRRWSGYSEGSVSPTLPDRVSTYYHTPRAFARSFAPWFRVRDCRALLLLLPPPYLAGLMQRFPRVFNAVALFEPHLAGWPVLRGLGDHFWLELERL